MSVRRYEAEASKCHDYRKTITDSFVCPEGYADKIRRVAGNFVYKMNQIFCDGAGTPMISMQIRMNSS